MCNASDLYDKLLKTILMKLLECINRIMKLDQMIRLEITGSPQELAAKFNISERQIYRLIDQMRSLGAEISYSQLKNSYIYLNPVKFNFGFIPLAVGEDILN